MADRYLVAAWQRWVLIPLALVAFPFLVVLVAAFTLPLAIWAAAVWICSRLRAVSS